VNARTVRFLFGVVIVALIFTVAPMTTKALGTPEIVSVSPLSPQPVGTRVTIRVRVDWDSEFRAMRICFPERGCQESGETEFERAFDTSGLPSGDYEIRVEAARQGDNSWSNPNVAMTNYTLTAGQSQPPPPTGPPQVSCQVTAISVNPTSGTEGQDFSISGGGTCNTGVRATRLSVDAQIIYELGAPNASRSWNSSGQAGTHTATVEVAGWGDNNWTSAARQSVQFTVTRPSQSPPPQPAPQQSPPQPQQAPANPSVPFQNGDVVQLGPDIYVILDGWRHLVPNPATLDALGISRDMVNNHGFSRDELEAIPRAADIPDVNRDPNGFTAFKDALFPGQSPISPRSVREPVESQDNTCPESATRLSPGDIARVSNFDPSPLNVRSYAGLENEVVFRIPAAEPMSVISGPVCHDGYRWYEVGYQGRGGWSAEVGPSGNYLLIPNGMPLPGPSGAGQPAGQQQSPSDDCERAIDPGLRTGDRGMVDPNDTAPNELQDTPHGSITGNIPQSHSFDIVGGPVCRDGWLWLEVVYQFQRGWTATSRRDGTNQWVYRAEEQQQPSDPLEMLPSDGVRVCIAPDNPDPDVNSGFSLVSVAFAARNRGFESDQCTYHLDSIYRQATRECLPSEGANAHVWDENLRDCGYAVSNTPEIGDIAVWEASVAGNEYGHVAYVTGVNADGTFSVSERNLRGDGQEGIRSNVQVESGISFVHILQGRLCTNPAIPLPAHDTSSYLLVPREIPRPEIGESAFVYYNLLLGRWGNVELQYMRSGSGGTLFLVDAVWAFLHPGWVEYPRWTFAWRCA